MVSLKFWTTFASVVGYCLATGPSYIASPKNGTHVGPGASFPFHFNPLGDYCQSDFNYTVYVFTSKPRNFLQSDTWATGHYFGTFTSGEQASTGDPEPSSLTMPDFSKSPGGFGTGKTASNLPVYLTVIEQTATCDAALGTRFALRYITLIYNATIS